MKHDPGCRSIAMFLQKVGGKKMLQLWLFTCYKRRNKQPVKNAHIIVLCQRQLYAQSKDKKYSIRETFSIKVWVIYSSWALGERQINLLALDLFFLILVYPVYKMWIIEEPNTLELWNKLHFEEKKNGEYTPCLKYSVPINI